MKSKQLILRADGNNLIGFGHIYRLLALADILKDKFHFTFVFCKTDNFIEEEIKKYCDEIIILEKNFPYKTPDEIRSAHEIEFDLDNILNANKSVVLDGYYFGPYYQQQVKKRNAKLICIDDLAENHFFADIVINHAPGLDYQLYKKEAYTKLYTGLEYAILRKPFFKPLTGKTNNDVFISLGGSDHFQITEKIVGFISDIQKLGTLHIMYSSSYDPDMIKRIEMAYKVAGKIKFYKNLSANEIVELMDNCKYAFVSASTVLLESYFRGLICFTGYYTANQLHLYNGFIKEKKAAGLGDLRCIDEETIRRKIVHVSDIHIKDSELNTTNNLINVF